MKPTPKAGRPPKPPDQVKTEVFTARCTPEQKAKYEQLKKEMDIDIQDRSCISSEPESL